ncbi:MAG: DsbA family oxidoreductase [Actinobacteria bacterium]|nr:DsbA family oxidoreductase [Actinomycetota bacterium]MCB9390836.1 DsbA family oxidoreductase [Acidimicrobiia bacterium]
MKIDIWSDVICPFCLLGKRRLDAALAGWEHAGDVEVVWHSFELDPNAPRDLGGTLVEKIANKYGVSVEQSRASQQDIARQFTEVGAIFDWERAKPGNTFDAHRVFHLAVERGLGNEVMSRFMTAYFAEGAAIGEVKTVQRLAVEAGLDADEVRSVLDGDAYGDAVRSDELAARQMGVSGVPFFVFDHRLAVSGAQPVEVFVAALNQAWDTQVSVPTPFTSAGSTGEDDAKVCGPDGCAIDDPRR